MMKKQKRLLIALVTTGVMMILIGLILNLLHGWSLWLVFIGALVAQSSVLLLSDRLSPIKTLPDEPNGDDSVEAQQVRFTEWQQLQFQELEQEKQLLDERQRELATRFARYHEFLEYPDDVADLDSSTHSPVRLSVCDRQVHELLEAEAARVYEKIRQNGYTVDGKVDLVIIREEVMTLVQNVARIYAPDSANPLLETSFEQLARAASRICLHSLVLLERLPVDVKHYNINEIHSYLKRAVQGYGTYQQVAPWFKHLSRGAYFGRLAAGTNPVSLGAWWLATEVGRRGAQKLVENVVDRQAVAALHDIVTVIGVEVANVYGPGYRQRDAAWVYGAELTELLRRFPVSRESLTEALRVITVLPLRNEYDRVYLYRCVANHRAAGFRIPDSAMISRPERDAIAQKLEAFFHGFIHGVTDKEAASWRDDVESRLDLKLKFDQAVEQPATHDQVTACVHAVYTFLVSVASVDRDKAKALVGQTDLMTRVPLESRASVLDSLEANDSRFSPPDLDPSAELTECFLKALMETLVEGYDWDRNVEELALETAGYYRRSRVDAEAMFDAACAAYLQTRCARDIKVRRLTSEQVSGLLQTLTQGDLVQAVFEGVGLKYSERVTDQSESVLAVIQGPEETLSRLALVQASSDENPVWTAHSNWHVGKRKGFLIDDCELTGGEWSVATVVKPDSIVLSGSITGGGYDKMFAELLRHQPSES